MRLIAALYVKPLRETNKSDFIVAEAITEAAARPTMRFVPIKSDDWILITVAVANPPRPDYKMLDARPARLVWPVRPSKIGHDAISVDNDSAKIAKGS